MANRRLPALGLLIAIAIAAPAALASPPDRAFKTPVQQGGPQAQASISGAELAGALRPILKRAGGAAGAFVSDPETGQVLFSSRAQRQFMIASNMKMFTTATALDRIGPLEQFETTLVAPSGFAAGAVAGDLVLRGGGDPTLTGAGLGKLAAEARAKGLASIGGRLLYDESLFDKRRAVPQKGISGGPFGDLGRLSGLSFEGGRSRDPAMAAALSMVGILRKAGLGIPKKTAKGSAPAQPAPENLVADLTSPTLAAIARTTNTFSVNFYAEMLMKAIAAETSGRGTTAAGAAIVRSFAAQAGGSLRTQNGSGLSRADRASPQSIGALLGAMLKKEDTVRDAFLSSLAVAGGTGTLARRMRGTAAQGRCIGKTGTLTGVSALSGYCQVAPERFVVFSILNNGVDVGRAHIAQDRMVAAIARYTP